MKKFLSLVLCLVLCSSILCACKGDNIDTESIDTPSVDLSYNDVSCFIPGETNKTSESQTEASNSSTESSEDNNQSNASSVTSQPAQQTGRFVVKVAKYDYNNYLERKFGTECPGEPYKDVSIAILDITNETNKHYSVKIHGKYLDKDGKVLKTETQEWDQFASGWQKYFLFRPEMAFDKFEYTLETKEFNGDCWKTKISLTFLNLQKWARQCYPPTVGSGNLKWVESLMSYCRCNDGNKPYCHGFIYLILFDEAKQVIGVYRNGRSIVRSPRHESEGLSFVVYYADPDENDGKFKEWPEIFCGNVTGIYVFTWIDDIEKFEERLKNEG